MFEYLMPPKITTIAQGEHVSSLTLMSKGEKRTGLGAFVAINAKGGDFWHVLQEVYACH